MQSIAGVNLPLLLKKNKSPHFSWEIIVLLIFHILYKKASNKIDKIQWMHNVKSSFIKKPMRVEELYCISLCTYFIQADFKIKILLLQKY